MSRGSRAGDAPKRAGSVEARFRDLLDAGRSHQDIRTTLVGEGAKPGTVDTYLKTQAGDDLEDRIMAGRVACDAHLSDLQREHGI